MNIDQLLSGDVSSLCDVTVAAAACSLLQAVGRIHCRDCMQLKAKQECSSPEATSALGDVTRVPQAPFFTRPSATVTSPVKSDLGPNAVVKQTNVKREIIIKTGKTDVRSNDNQRVNRTKSQNDKLPPAVLQAVSPPSASIPHPSVAAAVIQPRPRLQLSPPAGSNLIPQLRPILATLDVATKLRVPRPPAPVNATSNIANTSDVTVISIASATAAKTSVSSPVFSTSPLIVSASGHSPTHLTILSAGQTAVTNVVASADEAAARRIRIENMTVAKLRAECRRLRLPITGPKPNLVRRLVQNAEAFRNDDTSSAPVSTVTCTTASSPHALTSSSILQSVLTHRSQVAAVEPTSSPETEAHLRMPATGGHSAPQVEGTTQFFPGHNEFQSNPGYDFAGNQKKAPEWFTGLPDAGARTLPAVLGRCNSDSCDDMILKSPASLNHATTRAESESPTVGGPPPPQNQDPEQLSLWQSQQKLIEELRRQLEQSRRAIVEARLQRNDSQVTMTRDAMVSAAGVQQVDTKLCSTVAQTGHVPQTANSDSDNRFLSATGLSGSELSASVAAASELLFNISHQLSLAMLPKTKEEKGSDEKDIYCQWNDEIADLLNECQQTDAGQMLDVDDWADSINFQWNDVEAANDTGVADSRSQSNELEAVDNQSPNSARTKKQLTVDINAASGQGQVVPDSDDMTWTSSPLDLTPNNAVDFQWSWWEWDDFLTPENLPETPGTDSGSSCVGWDSDGATHSPPPRGAERHLANAAEFVTYARRDLLLSMSSSRPLNSGHSN